jgi:4-hydroxyphenylacetate 3-monooxygenase
LPQPASSPPERAKADLQGNIMSIQNDLLDRVLPLLPELEARAQACEDARQVLDENVAALRAVGYLDAFKPKAYGGLELLPSQLYPVTAAIAGACPSTAWAMQLLIAHAHAVAYYDKKLQAEIWGADPTAMISSSVAPFGKTTAAEGGIRLSGHYSWSSGCDHASWAMVGFMKTNAATGEKEHALAILPRSDYDIVDTWFAGAMKGTGSKDLVVNDVFVPDYRIETFAALNFGQARGVGLHDGALFRLPFQPIFGGGFSAVALGIAKAALEKYRLRLADRHRAYTGAKVSESAPAYMKLAEAHHIVMAAEALLTKEWANFDFYATSGTPPDMDVFIGWRTTQAFATKLSVQAVNLVFGASGGGAIYSNSPLQRLFRDAQATAAHAYSDYDVVAQILGRHLIGLPMDAKLL